jgi:tetratricopeptide (TPR) repeat protein
LNLLDVSGLAHQGLMVEMAEAGDFDTALRHGWQALSAARAQGSREAEALINLAQLCADAGYDAAALGAFAAALARTTAPRIRIPAHAGTAAAAGRLRDRTRLAQAERAMLVEASDAFPFEVSRAWLSIARAKRALGDTSAADAAAEKAAAIARAHGFHEITHHVEQEMLAKRAALSPAGLEIVKSLATWSDHPSDSNALSSVSTG